MLALAFVIALFLPTASAAHDDADEPLLRLFPAGSLAPPSDARAKAWQGWARFEALATELADTAGRLEAATGTGAASGALAAAFKGVAQTCATCHKLFRAKKN